MDIKWAAKRLMQRKPVRRKSWRLGEFVGYDGALFYSISDKKNYNSPSVVIDYDPSLNDLIANDWEPVKILEPDGK